MNFASALFLLYLLFLIGLFTFLLIRGVTHSFIACFAAGAFLELIPHLGILALREMPGGFSANQGYYPILMVFGSIGTICFAAGFFLLAKFLLNPARVAA
ncbi:MAG: hypothetical protein M3R10_00700 [Verrucomicrobiota bacterium]|nr:hypothetical protein [Verrucomicrobiota bacterium]